MNQVNQKKLQDLRKLQDSQDWQQLKHLKRLSAVRSNSGIRFLTPAVSPGNHCPMRIASVIVEDVPGLSSLLVGMPECTTHSRLFSPKPEGKNGELHWLYVLDSNEVVFGCREGLIDALKTMDRAGAKAILLIVTCIPELIGEDIEGIIHEVQPELSARVTFVMLGQFKNVSYPPGSWKTMEALATLMDSKATDGNRINVLGRSPEEDHIPMPSVLPVLEQKGFALRYLAPGASSEDFQNAPDAALNLVVSPYAQPLAVKMEKEFSVPYIALHNLYEVEEIDRAYNDIAERLDIAQLGRAEQLGREDEVGLVEHIDGFSSDIFAKERREALDLQSQVKDRVQGLTYVLSARIDLPIPLSIYLSSLGMEPLLLHMEEFYPEDRINARKLIDMGHNPPVCRLVNIEVDFSILEELNPDLCFGYLPYTNKTIACVDEMFDFYGQVGYTRTSAILTRILQVLDKAQASKEQVVKSQGGMKDGIASV